MALSYVGSGEGSDWGSDVTATATLPAGIATNDVVYVAVVGGTRFNEDTSLTTPGYTELADLYANDSWDVNLGVYRKVMGATPDSSVEGYVTGQEAGTSVVAHVWRGADITTPEDTATTTNTGISASAPDSPAIVTVTNNAVVLAVGGSAMNDTTITAPSGYSNQVDATDNHAGDGPTACIASKVVATGGTSENPAAWGSFTAETSACWAAATVAIRPAADAGGGTGRKPGRGLTHSVLLGGRRLAA